MSAKHFGKREKQQITGKIQKECTEEMTFEPNLKANGILFLNLTNPYEAHTIVVTLPDRESLISNSSVGVVEQ